MFLETAFFFICMLFLAAIFHLGSLSTFPHTRHTQLHTPHLNLPPPTHTLTEAYKDRKKIRKKTKFGGPREGCGQPGRMSTMGQGEKLPDTLEPNESRGGEGCEALRKKLGARLYSWFRGLPQCLEDPAQRRRLCCVIALENLSCLL